MGGLGMGTALWPLQHHCNTDVTRLQCQQPRFRRGSFWRSVMQFPCDHFSGFVAFFVICSPRQVLAEAVAAEENEDTEMQEYRQKKLAQKREFDKVYDGNKLNHLEEMKADVELQHDKMKKVCTGRDRAVRHVCLLGSVWWVCLPPCFLASACEVRRMPQVCLCAPKQASAAAACRSMPQHPIFCVHVPVCLAVFFVRRPRSACHVERTFSLMGHIQTKDRLHMGNNTLRHLAMMYVNKPTTDDPDGESD